MSVRRTLAVSALAVSALVPAAAEAQSFSCRTTASSTPCLRATNASSGRAFLFRGSSATTLGIFQIGSRLSVAQPNARPFVTNATGVATGLNADRVDGLDAGQIVSRAREHDGLDADTLDGLSPAQIAALAQAAPRTCPSGTTASSGACIETNVRGSLPFAEASESCGGSGRRLPTASELLSSRNRGITLVTAELTSDLLDGTSQSSPVAYVTVTQAGGFQNAALITASPFRCVAAL